MPGPIQRVSDPAVDTCLLLSDWHVGLTADIVGNSFSAEKFKERIGILKNEIVETYINKTNRTKELHVFLLGDMVDAVLRNMHDSMAYQQDMYGIDQSMLAATGMVDIIKSTHELLGGDLKVYSIGGNHGRCTPDRNGDRTRIGDQSAYAIAMASLSNQVDNLRWYMEQETNFIRTVIQNNNIMASHGDNLPSNLRASAWANMGEEMRNTIFLSGHKHTYSVQQMTNILKIENGSLCGGNQYSIDVIAERSEPSQTMFDIIDGKVRSVHHLFV
jgi:predicted phosphodiesterase